jgi:hypothetical protein
MKNQIAIVTINKVEADKIAEQTPISAPNPMAISSGHYQDIWSTEKLPVKNGKERRRERRAAERNKKKHKRASI